MMKCDFRKAINAHCKDGRSSTDRRISDHIVVLPSSRSETCVMASYRFCAPSGVTLKLGDNQTLSSVLDPSVWSNCYGEHDTSGFAGALENAMGIGFTFGGQSFFSHGVYLSRGTATFKVNSYTGR